MKKNYIKPAVAQFNVHTQSMIALSFGDGEANPSIDVLSGEDYGFDNDLEEWNSWKSTW